MGHSCWALRETDTAFFTKGIVAIGFADFGDLSKLPRDREAFKARLQQVYPTTTQAAVNLNAGQLFRFVFDMAAGHYVAYPRRSTPESGTSDRRSSP